MGVRLGVRLSRGVEPVLALLVIAFSPVRLSLLLFGRGFWFPLFPGFRFASAELGSLVCCCYYSI
jgi:hypothetical protein